MNTEYPNKLIIIFKILCIYIFCIHLFVYLHHTL